MADALSTKLSEYYDTLELRPGATAREIRKAARRLLMINHPDLNPGGGPALGEATRRINEAYAELMKSAPRDDAPQALPRQQPDASPDSLVFTLSGMAFAIPSGFIRGVLRMKDVRMDELGMAASALPHMVGVFNHAGALTLLWNLQAQLRLKETPLSTDLGRRRVVVAEIDSSMIGFIADEVLGIMDVGAAAVVPGDYPGVDPSYICGAGAAGEVPVLLLNVEAVVS